MKLRFKDENGNNYPDWENKRLDTLTNFKGGGTPSTTNENYWSGTIPWLSSSDLNQSNFVYKISKKISSDAIENSSTNLIPPGSILLVNRVGLGKLAITKSHLCTSQDFLNLVDIKINTVYLGYALKLKANFEALQVQGTSIKGIPSSVIKKWEICIPKSIEEQEKIGSFFKLQDEVIELKEELIKEKREYKKGLLQKVFNQELRFKDKNGNDYPDWEEIKLGETVDFLSGLKGKSKEDFFNGSNSKYIQFKQIFESKVRLKNLGDVEIGKTEIQNMVQKNDLIMNMTSESIEEIGTVAINELSIKNLYLNSFSNILRTKDRFSAHFMKYKMATTDVKLKIQKEGQGITRINLANSRLVELRLSIPQSIEEQEKIGNLFKLIDEEIELLENEVIQLKQKKKYYLSVMM